MRQVAHVLPKDASVAPLVAQAAERGLPVSTGSAGAIGITASRRAGPDGRADQGVPDRRAEPGGPAVRLGRLRPERLRLLRSGAVVDAAGWHRHAAGRRRSGADRTADRRSPTSQPGDLLFYHTDPTAPTYISHVAIYLGKGLMLQAPEPGEDVQIVPAIFGAGFAGAVRVYPRVAAAVAGNLAG